MGFADRLTRQSADGGSTRAAGAVVILFIAVTTASTRLMEQYYLQKSYLVLLSSSWSSSTNPIYRGYYCSLVQGKAVLLAESALSTAFVRLMEQ